LALHQLYNKMNCSVRQSNNSSDWYHELLGNISQL